MTRITGMESGWTVEDSSPRRHGAVACLSGRPVVPHESENIEPWAADSGAYQMPDDSSSGTADIRARMRSRKIPAKVGMQ